MKNITIIGTNHISQESVTLIKKEFFKIKPDIIGIELDKQRLHALLTNQKPNYHPRAIFSLGLKTYFFALIAGLIQQKLGKIAGMKPGADMKQAAILAQQNNIPLLLLDQTLQKTLKRLTSQLTFKEKLRLLEDILFGWAKKQKIKINLTTIPSEELLTKILTQLKKRYPTFYRVLIKERNIYMAERLAAAHHHDQNKKFLVILGAGHEKGFKEAFEKAIKTLLNHHIQ